MEIEALKFIENAYRPKTKEYKRPQTVGIIISGCESQNDRTGVDKEAKSSKGHVHSTHVVSYMCLGRCYLKDWRAIANDKMVAGTLLSFTVGALEPACKV